MKHIDSKSNIKLNFPNLSETNKKSLKSKVSKSYSKYMYQDK